MSKIKLLLEPLTSRGMTAFETLMSGREFGGCFCAVWREFGADWEERCRKRSHENLESTRKVVKAGGKTGFLIKTDSTGEVVAWCGAGPKTSFPLLKDKPGSRLGPFDDSTWAVACLAVAFKHRGLGISRGAVELVAAEAQRSGAKAIEGYPLDPESDQGAYRGSRALFESAGFRAAGSEPSGDGVVLRMVREFS